MAAAPISPDTSSDNSPGITMRSLYGRAVDPNLSGDEWLILRSIDPKFKLREQLERANLARRDHTKFLEQVHSGYEAPSMIPDGARTTSLGIHQIDLPRSGRRGAVGGFPFAAVLPFITPLIGPLITQGISLIKGAIERKKASGSGVVPPNFRGAGIADVAKDYFVNNHDRLAGMEEQLSTLRGRDFWRTLTAFVKGELASLGPSLGDIAPKVAAMITERLVKKMIPQSFQNLNERERLPEKEAEGAGKTADLYSIILPVVKWSVSEILGPEALDVDMRQKIKDVTSSAVEKYQNSRDRAIIKGRHIIEKAKSIARKVLLDVLPTAVDKSKDAIEPIIDKALGKFGIDTGAMQEIYSEMEARFAREGDSPSPERRAPRKGRLVRGSEEAKARMAEIRAMRGRIAPRVAPAVQRGGRIISRDRLPLEMPSPIPLNVPYVPAPPSPSEALRTPRGKGPAVPGHTRRSLRPVNFTVRLLH